MKEVQLRYWQAFREVLLSAQGPARPQKPRPDSYSLVAIGRSGFHLAAGTNSQAAWIRAELYFDHTGLKKQAPYRDANAYFGALKQEREAIERELEFSLEWEDLSTKGSCRVAIYNRKCDPNRRVRLAQAARVARGPPEPAAPCPGPARQGAQAR